MKQLNNITHQSVSALFAALILTFALTAARAQMPMPTPAPTSKVILILDCVTYDAVTEELTATLGYKTKT
jgi:hypothetical protein